MLRPFVVQPTPMLVRLELRLKRSALTRAGVIRSMGHWKQFCNREDLLTFSLHSVRTRYGKST